MFSRKMHDRNPYRTKPPDFAKLARKYPEFRRFCSVTSSGKICVDFSDSEFVRILGETLLKDDFGLNVNLPKDFLVPRIPQRLNYLLTVNDVLEQNSMQQNIIGLDIGCGPSCIYALLGRNLFHWRFYATDINQVAVDIALENVAINPAPDSIEILRTDGSTFFKNVMDKEENITFCMCNPPFFNDEEMDSKFGRQRGVRRNYCGEFTNAPRSATVGRDTELTVEGGEIEFVKRIIGESIEYKHRFRFFTTMLGKKCSIMPLRKFAEANGYFNISVAELNQDHWEFTIVLSDIIDGTSIAEKPLTWPYKDPPSSIEYDEIQHLLIWENAESTACLPLRIPTRRVDTILDLTNPISTKSNSKIVIAPNFDGETSTVPKESPWKVLLRNAIAQNGKSIANGTNGKSNGTHPKRQRVSSVSSTASSRITRSMSKTNGTPMRNGVETSEDELGSPTRSAKEDAWQILMKSLKSAPDFNPLIESRFSTEEQVKALKSIASHYTLRGMPKLLQRLIKMRFFEFRSINAFLCEYCCAVASIDSDDSVVKDLLRGGSFLLSDEGFISVLRLCRPRGASELRDTLLRHKNIPKGADLSKKLSADFTADEALDFAELLLSEYVFVDGDVSLFRKAVDIISFLFLSVSDTLLWSDDEALRKRTNELSQCLRKYCDVVHRLSEIKAQNSVLAANGYAFSDAHSAFRTRVVKLYPHPINSEMPVKSPKSKSK